MKWFIALTTDAIQARDTEEGPPRTEGVVPLREAERGKAQSASGGDQCPRCCGSTSCKIVVAISSIDLVVLDSHSMPLRRIMASASATS